MPKLLLMICLSTSFLVMQSACSSHSSTETTTSPPKASADSTSTPTSSDSISTLPAAESDSTTTVPANAWALVPGVSAGQTKLQENGEAVIQRLGKPDGGDAAMGKAVSIWYSHHDTTAHSMGIYTQRKMGVDETPRIAQIRVTSPSFRTQEGIHTTSTLDEIKRHFDVKKTDSFRDANTLYTVYTSKKGISFELDTQQRCVAIIIHQAGTDQPGTYLPIRTTNRYIQPKS